MQALRLDGIVLEQGVLALALLVIGEILTLDGAELGGDIRKHEEVLILRGVGQDGYALVGELDAVVFLVNHEV